ncbi:DUF1905 domain-containing protein [Novosphingobium bradum]|uniref:DUF1905 domain-containing protein n=1 Tax=Novosphingobium bradum TaxID=1737444 RepID=A0ABV7ISU4_9SPHN
MEEHISCTARLWRWTGGKDGKGGAWHFLTIAGKPAEVLAGTALMRRLDGSSRGFGSLRVSATISETTWQTSVFPEKSATDAPEWLLPVKAAVRKAEHLDEGDEAALDLLF